MRTERAWIDEGRDRTRRTTSEQATFRGAKFERLTCFFRLLIPSINNLTRKLLYTDNCMVSPIAF